MRSPPPLVLASVLAALAVGAPAGCDCAGIAGGGGEGEGGHEGEGQGGEGEGQGGEGEGEGAVACIDGLTDIALAPADSAVDVDGSTPLAVDFTATGTVHGVATQLDPARLAWAVARADDTDPGVIAAGHMDVNPRAGGVVVVTATDGCVAGGTTLTLHLAVDIGTPTGDPADWNSAPVTTGTLPTLVYPSDQTRFPRNIFRQLFQWQRAGYTEFRITFAGDFATVTVFSDGVNPTCAAVAAAGCFEADEDAWTFVAGSNAGGTAVVTLDALDRSTATPTVRRAPSITIGFSKRDVQGAVFYWSTTSAGVRRANIRDAAPEDYIAAKPIATHYDVEGNIKCVACHTVSRSGRFMTAPVSAQSVTDSLWVLDVTPTAPPTPLVTAIADTRGHGFATFSPDDQFLVAAWGGRLWDVDRVTGADLGDIDLGGLDGTHPDWSPDGSQLVFATAKGDAPGGAGLAMVPSLGGTSWGAAEVVLPVPAAGSAFFPMFSPDGLYVAFVEGRGGHGDVTAKLFVADASARPLAPVELTAANTVVNNQVTNGQNANLGPTWAPPGDLYWVAFNSKRAFGLVAGAQHSQIWVAAVDPAKLAQGGIDPSYPAFRLPSQGLAEDNHRAFWALDVRDEPPPDAGPDAGTPDAGTPPPDAGTVDAGTPVDAGPCLASGDICDPTGGAACCSGSVCDTLDNGATYTCIFIGG